jgi:signal transduction histidine kinase
VATAIANANLFATAKRERARAEEANRAKDAFLAAVSHELRTPLQAILGWSRILRKPELDAERRAKALDTIDRNARVQAQLIEDLLDVSRLVYDKLELVFARVRLQDVVEAAIATMKPSADATGVNIVAMLDGPDAVVRADVNRLQQVVWNLVSNAVKFTPLGGRVDVRLVRDGAFVEVVVTDTGRGIEPDFLPFVFDRFRQAGGPDARRAGGLGLGLAIARQLVELHGGTIAASSDGVGRGATFTVRLPLA